MLEARIAHLEEKLRSATVVDEKNSRPMSCGVGTTVHLKDQKTEKSCKFKIVGSPRPTPAEGKLSNESPIGKALIGRKRNEIVKSAGAARSAAPAEDHQD